MGYLYFDDNGTTDTIYFARITGLRQGRLVLQISANADDAHTTHSSDSAVDSSTQVSGALLRDQFVALQCRLPVSERRHPSRRHD